MRGLRPFSHFFPLPPMSASYQGSIWGQSEFLPPKFKLRNFLDRVAEDNPHLLDPCRHNDLMMAFARYVGLKPGDWGIRLSAIKWLMEISPDVERACRNYRADAF